MDWSCTGGPTLLKQVERMAKYDYFSSSSAIGQNLWSFILFSSTLISSCSYIYIFLSGLDSCNQILSLFNLIVMIIWISNFTSSVLCHWFSCSKLMKTKLFHLSIPLIVVLSASLSNFIDIQSYHHNNMNIICCIYKLFLRKLLKTALKIY